MPAGDLITGDYQVELRGNLYGATTGVDIDVAGIKGLGTPSPKTSDSSYDGQDGSAAAPDFLDVRVITIPFVVTAVGDAGTGMGGLDFINDGWAPARDGVDQELHIQLPGIGHVYFIGRPRGVDDDLALLPKGSIVRAITRFDAIDPTRHTFGA